MSDASPLPRYGTPNAEYLARLAAMPAADAGPVYMVNLMKYRERADYPDDSYPPRSGREADAEYRPSAILREVGARIIFAAEVERQLLGDFPRWDRVGVVRYPSRAAFLAVQERPDFKEKHIHKEAGVERTIVLACLRAPLPEFPAPSAGAVTAGDRPFVMMHLMKFAEAGRAAVAAYGATAGAAGMALGVRPAAYFQVEDTVIGDGREWDEVRFNRFPSHAVFDELRANETHRAGQLSRQTALADSYSMMLSPNIDRFTAED